MTVLFALAHSLTAGIVTLVVPASEGREVEIKQNAYWLGNIMGRDEATGITAMLKGHGLNPGTDLLPVAPALHYAMGGVQTSARDYARWVAFLLSAWPPRDGPEQGPVRRSSVRELEGSIIKLLAYASLKHRDITVDRSPLAKALRVRSASRTILLTMSRPSEVR